MYFNEEKINSLLLSWHLNSTTKKKDASCKYCESRLDEPRILPCGENICSIFSSSIKCSCKRNHDMPKLGL